MIRAARVTPGHFQQDARVKFIGTPDTFAGRTLEQTKIYTVTSASEYLGDIRLRLAERPGFAFLAELFVRA